MRHGHVAVVTRVLGTRQVLVDHANWAPSRGRGRGRVSKMVAVTDVSPSNDWTQVRVWNTATGEFGTRVYPTYGFIYPRSWQSHLHQASLSTVDAHFAAVLAEARPRPAPAAANAPAAVHAAPAAVSEDHRPHAKAAPLAALAASASDGVWEDDLATAKRFGAGHY